jgi:N-sulfoglucosamine sulfohydrolase
MRLLILLLVALCVRAEQRPNIVWIVGEDMGPELGCYGDRYARTPNLDRFASEGVRFTRAFTHAPVCAPSRSGLITGRYPTSIGTHHMRSKLLKPPPLFTDYLRKAGYFVAWPGKTDFNFDVPTNSFDSTRPWLRNVPRQPFFAYTNIFLTHESQIRAAPAQFAKNTSKLSEADRHDPAKAPLPPYSPDAPEVRRDLANYYDLCTAVDYQVGEILKRLDELGLGTNTIVFFFGDHGRGLPRSKRWVYDSGTHVPLIVRWPNHLKGGGVREDLVSFIDFAPTVLSLAGVEIPKELQGQPFLGPKQASPRKYVYAARDRMDETYDRIRSVRDARFQYIRNYHPELPYAQRISYMEEMPTMQVWRKWNAEGRLDPIQKLFFASTKPTEELYDTEADPHEVVNLADRPQHKAKLEELRSALDRWMLEVGDFGAMPESELVRRGLVKDVSADYEARKPK